MADGAALYLKHGTGEVAAALADEAARLSWLAGRVPAARVHRHVIEADRGWLMTEALDGRPAGDWLVSHPERMAEVISAMAGFLRALHALPAQDCPFDASLAVMLPLARANVAEGLVDEGDFDDDHLGWSADAVLAKVESLAGHASGRVVTHGDFSLGNILLDAQMRVTGCIDTGRLGLADPYQDHAIAWRDLGNFGEEAQALFLRAMDLDPVDPDRLLLHRTLDELF